MATANLPPEKFNTDTKFIRPENPPVRVALDNLDLLPEFNTRMRDDEYEAAVASVQDSITRHGFYDNKPLAVVMVEGSKKVYVYDGEHRLMAAKRAALEGVEFPDGLPVSFAKDGATVRDLTISLVRNNDGRNLNPVEMAAVVKRLEDMGMSPDEIAEEIGRTPRMVNNLKTLHTANAATKRAVSSGQIAAAVVTKKLRQDSPADVDKFVKEQVAKAQASGAKKATPKTMASGPKMMKVEHSISLGEGDTVAAVMKALENHVTEALRTNDKGELTEDGKITVTLLVVDQEAERVKAEREAAKAKAEAEKKAAAKKAEADKKAKAEADKKAKAEANKKTNGPSKATGSKSGGKAPAKGKAPKTEEASQKPVEADSKASTSGNTGQAAESAPEAVSGASDGNNGL